MTLHKLNHTRCRRAPLITFTVHVRPEEHSRNQSSELPLPWDVIVLHFITVISHVDLQYRNLVFRVAFRRQLTSHPLLLGGVTWRNEPTCECTGHGVISCRVPALWGWEGTPPRLSPFDGPALLIPLCSSSVAFLAVTNGEKEKPRRVRQNSSLSLLLPYSRDPVPEC